MANLNLGRLLDRTPVKILLLGPSDLARAFLSLR